MEETIEFYQHTLIEWKTEDSEEFRATLEKLKRELDEETRKLEENL